MDLFNTISFDQIGMAFLTIFVIRKVMVYALPDYIAGPGGRFINTGCADSEQ